MRPSRKAILAWLPFTIIVSIGVVRMAATFPLLTQVYDEPYHIAAGMEWLDKGKYEYDPQHPPLTRVLAAIGPYLRGVRSHGLESVIDEGNAILATRGEYWKNLAAARAGTILFYILACLVVWLWARRWYGEAASWLSLLLFSCLPPILAHAGLATTDMGAAATTVTALYCFIRWLEDPSWKNNACLAIALALAFAAKYSAVIFLPPCFVVILALYWRRRRTLRLTLPYRTKSRFLQLAASMLIAVFALWALLRFEMKPLVEIVNRHPTFETRIPFGVEVKKFLEQHEWIRIPLVEAIEGIGTVFVHNQEGHGSFLLGEFRQTGWWYFFPVVLFFKTPLGTLILAIAGVSLMVYQFQSRPWQQVAAAACALMILAVSMQSRINLGVRHILHIYPLLAVVAGSIAAEALYLKKFWLSLAVAGLVLFSMVESIRAHPDYLSYTNSLAGSRPERIFGESDLDWGQDLDRLARRLKELAVKKISIAYFGTADLGRAGLPEYHVLKWHERATGWIAVSVRELTVTNGYNGAYGWLKERTPTERIGRSIFLYRVD